MQPRSVNQTATLTLDDLVSRTTDLPSIPAAAIAVMREADSPQGSAATVAKYLGQDQSLTIRVLRLANSSYYGLSRKVTDVPEAVVVLGMRCVKNLAMVASTYPWMMKPLKGYDLGPSQMWAHSFGVAVGAQMLATHTKKASPDVAFTAGLLHDLGKVVLSVWMENKIATMASIADKGGLSFDSVERKVLGFDHQDVGAHLARQWNLPEQLVECMAFHHRPNECDPPSTLVDCVHLADYLTMTMGLGVGGDGLCYEVSEASMERLGIDPDELPLLASEFLESYEKHEKLFEVLKA